MKIRARVFKRLRLNTSRQDINDFRGENGVPQKFRRAKTGIDFLVGSCLISCRRRSIFLMGQRAHCWQDNNERIDDFCIFNCSKCSKTCHEYFGGTDFSKINYSTHVHFIQFKVAVGAAIFIQFSVRFKMKFVALNKNKQ